MRLSYLVTLVVIITSFHQAYAAKIYKCKDANGKVVFSNFACDGDDTDKGVVGTNRIGSSNAAPVYKIEVDDGLSPAERQLKSLRDQEREEMLNREMQREASRKRAEEASRLEAERERQQRAAQVNKAQCEYYETQAEYYEHGSKEKGISKSRELTRKSIQKHYELDYAKECK